jgi:hypothetical protein
MLLKYPKNHNGEVNRRTTHPQHREHERNVSISQKGLKSLDCHVPCHSRGIHASASRFYCSQSIIKPQRIEASAMSRRTNRKINYTELDEEIIETAVVPVSTPKKARKAVKVVSTEVVTQAEKTSPTKGYKKVKAEADSEEEDTAAPAKSPAKAKVKKVKAKTVLEGDPASKPKKAPAKRKAKTDDEDEEGADDNKVKKKRKTKEEKEAEAMPLAERTAIGALKKAMHIGAHVSAAGGEYSITLHCPISP